MACSSVYETAPWGITDQPAFLNQVLRLSTTLSPGALLRIILQIEEQMGRVRVRKWGQRLIDIDILFYGNSVIAEEDLVIPHPGIAERRFVLEPLVEIAPQ